eukprot:GHRR01005878.1.p1 GENE.GHRR01005878.1~~GHRR01005878.1.p1  ORF type:complete len:317 (+),score=70.96 GHRR01005878.1:120-1070(+)
MSILTGNITGLVPNATTPIAAFSNNTLGLGFSGSGFLLFYFIGVSSMLRSLGVINNNTYLAGSSGGAITSTFTCAGVPGQQQFTEGRNALACLRNNTCLGGLGYLARLYMNATLPPDAAIRCGNKLFLTVTQATPRDVLDTTLLISNFTTNQQLVDASVASSYIPSFSGPTPVVYYKGIPAYDGGFSYFLPCPLGVTYCVTVSSRAPTNNIAAEMQFSAAELAFITTGNATLAPYLPLNPVLLRVPAKFDIYPGLSGPLADPTSWERYTLTFPPNDTILMQWYDQGRQDAGAWAISSSLANATAVEQALAATQLTA